MSIGPIGSLLSKNKTLLFKWLRGLCSPTQDKWKRLFVRSIVSVIKPGEETATSMRNCISFVVRNGKNVSLWNDRWAGNTIIKLSFPRLFMLTCTPAATVSDMEIWINGEWTWDLKWRRPLHVYEFQQCEALHQLLSSTTALLQDRNDRKIWNLYPDGNFIVKSCSSLIDIIEFNGACSFQTRVRISTTPLKMQTFTWLNLY